jgi:uncharacterized protein (TIGR02598 family)
MREKKEKRLPCRVQQSPRPEGRTRSFSIRHAIEEVTRHSRKEAFTLTEVALAMGIFSFALVSMLGLLSVGLKNSRRANVQISASNLMSAIASDIRSSTYLVKSGTYSYSSPRLKLTASVNARGVVSEVSPASTTLDESGSPADLTTPNPLLKLFTVNFAAASAGTTAIRVTVQWPPKISPATPSEGTLDALIPLPTP